MNQDETPETLEREADRAEREEAAEEREFEYGRPARPRGPSQVYSVRIPVEYIDRLRKLAAVRGEPPTALMRSWIIGRVDAESGTGSEVQVHLAPSVYEALVETSARAGLSPEDFATQVIALALSEPRGSRPGRTA